MPQLWKLFCARGVEQGANQYFSLYRKTFGENNKVKYYLSVLFCCLSEQVSRIICCSEMLMIGSVQCIVCVCSSP